MRVFQSLFTVGLFAFCIVLSTSAQETVMPNLSTINDRDVWGATVDQAKLIKDGDEVCVQLSTEADGSMIWLKDIDFANGTIEVDIKGKNTPGQNFAGIAFRGVDKETYDAVYFRPFNFQSDDPARAGHSVQYISHPEHPWHELRKNHPEKYENPIKPAPQPDEFFHAKIVIEKPKVSVFVNDAKEPCLVVDELTKRKGGWVGLWVGYKTEATFKNLKITPKK